MNIQTLGKLDSLFSDSPERHYKKGHILILIGDSTNYFYNLVSGTIKVYDVNYRGDEIVVNKFKEPSYFPMSLILNADTAHYIYEAEKDVCIRAVEKKRVLEFLDKNPTVVLDLLANLYKALNDVTSRYVLVATKNAQSRLIFTLIKECKKFAVSGQNGARILSISERELAASSGLSRETVSREMKSLKARNLVSSSRNLVKIHSLHKLEEYLEEHA
jgi:CRP-like cAMP-binding protein